MRTLSLCIHIIGNDKDVFFFLFNSTFCVVAVFYAIIYYTWNIVSFYFLLLLRFYHFMCRNNNTVHTYMYIFLYIAGAFYDRYMRSAMCVKHM